MPRDLTKEESLSLFVFMRGRGEFPDAWDYEIGDLENGWDYLTGNCPVRMVVSDSQCFLTVLLFWNEGNNVATVFTGKRLIDGSIWWELCLHNECNNALDYES